MKNGIILRFLKVSERPKALRPPLSSPFLLSPFIPLAFKTSKTPSALLVLPASMIRGDHTSKCDPSAHMISPSLKESNEKIANADMQKFWSRFRIFPFLEKYKRKIGHWIKMQENSRITRLHRYSRSRTFVAVNNCYVNPLLDEGRHALRISTVQEQWLRYPSTFVLQLL